MTRRRLQTNDVITPPPPSSSNDVSPNILITVLILAIAVIISATLYLILRFLRRNTTTTTDTSTTTQHPLSSTSSIRRRTTTTTNSRKVTPSTNDPLIDTLPLFTFDALSLSSSTGDCAVCLSKFESQDLLRLLPLCCHAFHADCIDTWLLSNQSCPLCRSPVFLPESELLSKLHNPNPNPARISSSGSSFRVEIGNVSQRHNNNNTTELNNNPSVRRSYSLGGNFDYILNEDDVVSEVHSGSFRRTFSSEFKIDDQQQQEVLAAEIGTRGGGGGGGGWLKEYLSSSLTSSFRSSGRWFFTGSSRRESIDIGNNNNRVTELDLEASRLGDEIGELFRWLSGV